MDYFLMRKDDIVTMVQISEHGDMYAFSKNYKNPELLPLCCKSNKHSLINWWSSRSVPIKQGRVASLLAEKNISCPGEFLLKNLGLSLTDYYWIRPVDVSLNWKDINLYTNDFKEDMMHSINGPEGKSGSSFAPNSSLQGDLEKSWQIRKGIRYLYKGNHGIYSAESINEVIASLLHKQQGYDNYTDYKLSKIKDKNYDYGCCCKAFTDEHREFVSAWDIINAKEKPDGQTTFEHFINVCAEYGIDESRLRKDLDYQIMTDYYISNRDRHMNNLGVIRDAETLCFIRLAPIFDSGKSMFAGQALPLSRRELDNYEINSFESTEQKMLKHVADTACVQVNKLPSADQICKLYKKDSKMPERQIDLICKAYEDKCR